MKYVILFLFAVLSLDSCIYDRHRELNYFAVNLSDSNICIASKIVLEDTITTVNLIPNDTVLLYNSATRGYNYERYDMDYFKKDLTIYKYDCKNLKIMDTVDFESGVDKKYLDQVPSVFIYFHR